MTGNQSTVLWMEELLSVVVRSVSGRPNERDVICAQMYLPMVKKEDCCDHSDRVQSAMRDNTDVNIPFPPYGINKGE